MRKTETKDDPEGSLRLYSLLVEEANKARLLSPVVEVKTLHRFEIVHNADDSYFSFKSNVALGGLFTRDEIELIDKRLIELDKLIAVQTEISHRRVQQLIANKHLAMRKPRKQPVTLELIDEGDEDLTGAIAPTINKRKATARARRNLKKTAERKGLRRG